MLRSGFSLLIIVFASLCMAQPASVVDIAKQCSTPDLKKNLYYLASDSMEGRLMASHGDTLASLFIASQFKKANLVAPYAGSYFQDITVNKKIVNASLNIKGTAYARYDGWLLYPPLPVHLQDVPVLYNDFKDLASLNDFIASVDVKGKAIIVPGLIMKKAFESDTINSIEAGWKAKGIVAVVWTGPVVANRIEAGVNRVSRGEFENKELDALFNSPKAPENILPEISLTPERMNSLLAADNIKVKAGGSSADSLQKPFILNNTISVNFQYHLQEVHAPNVIGVLQGSDTSLPCIVVSAHHDHDGRKGKEIWYGAVDNASGTVAIIEMAKLMGKAVEQGYRPKRTIVFASFTGEERGLLGSSYYVKHPLYPIQKTHGVLNIDMMGRVDTFYSGKRADSNYAYILVKDSLNRSFRKSLYNANASFVNLKLDTYYENPKYSERRTTGSDQFPFYLKGVPFVRIDCGFCIDYHKTSDTPDKINYDLLTRQTQLAFLTLWNISNE